MIINSICIPIKGLTLTPKSEAPCTPQASCILTPTPKSEAPWTPQASCILTPTPWFKARRTSSCDEEISWMGTPTQFTMRRQHELFLAR